MSVEDVIEYLDNLLINQNRWDGRGDCGEMNNIKAFLNGEWVESDIVQELLRLSFSECFFLFDFARTSEWWSIIGKTEEERKRNGQKVTILFRIKGVPCTWDERQKKGCIGWCGLPFC